MEDPNVKEAELIKLVQRQLTMKESLVHRRLVLSPTAAGNSYGRVIFFKILTDRSVRSKAVVYALQNAWNGEKKPQIKLISDGIWMAIFDHQEDLDRVLELAPWNFNNDLILLAAGSMNTKPSELNFSSFRLWVHFEDLPLEFCSETCIKQMAEQLGIVIKVECNMNWEVSHNRALVEFAVGQPFCKQLIVANLEGKEIVVPLTYEKLPRICTFCGCLGHSYRFCQHMKTLKKQIDKISDSKMKEELLSSLKPKYDNSIYYKKFSSSNIDFSSTSGSSEIPVMSDSKSLSESFSSTLVVAMKLVAGNPSNHGVELAEEVQSPPCVILKDINQSAAIRVPSCETEQILEKQVNITTGGLTQKMKIGELASPSSLIPPASSDSGKKPKADGGNYSLRKGKKVILMQNIDDSTEDMDVPAPSLLFQNSETALQTDKKKKRKTCSPKSPSASKKLKKAVGLDPLPDHQ